MPSHSISFHSIATPPLTLHIPISYLCHVTLCHSMSLHFNLCQSISIRSIPFHLSPCYLPYLIPSHFTPYTPLLSLPYDITLCHPISLVRSIPSPPFLFHFMPWQSTPLQFILRHSILFHITMCHSISLYVRPFHFVPSPSTSTPCYLLYSITFHLTPYTLFPSLPYNVTLCHHSIILFHSFPVSFISFHGSPVSRISFYSSTPFRSLQFQYHSVIWHFSSFHSTSYILWHPISLHFDPF